ncbi:LOW QUALITY PROTEIN: disease resistance protein RPV1 [Pyrus x bretschneideri]|uniref:LOW QUALITY PROTEIN: disease resistance protein RPV1 n=1 Tax=Pyrus x bretschneideri TaxID=225117 RepID=UPI00202DC4D4|nr:LOW QUALITY PROTEIN: disease resistance protein RPV1 [Pyrus x bretschneideri]
MEGLQKVIGKIPKDPPKLGSASASFDPHRGTEGLAAALSSSDQSRILLNRPASRDMNNCNAITVDSAMTAHEVSSSSSSKSKLWNYTVFFSFSGETRNGFTGHLHAQFKDRGYQAYIDEDDLKRTKEIKKELYQGIEESRISIIVFSKMYADSSWCLDELVKIMECRDKLGRDVLPIFYHVDPSHVRKQNGDFTEAFQNHEKDIHEEKDGKTREKVNQWRRALTEAANLSGYHLKITDNRHEATVIREIVDKVITNWLLTVNILPAAKHQVGIDSRIKDIITYLSSDGSDDVLMVGIWGMGGLGKTTSAKAIFNKIHHKFQFKCFLANVHDNTSKHGLTYLQEKLIFDILKQKSEISSVDKGISLIEDQFSHRKVLLIIDNIDRVEQLNAIAGNHKWFGPGSRIIITTRDEHLLKQGKVNKTYPAQKLNKEEALELLSWHAFGNRQPSEGFLELSEKFVSYCYGLPLALEVVGSFLVKRPIAEWECELKKLKTTPERNIIEALRISFEGLDDTQKAIFLDICCFFIGEDKDYVAKVLDECEFFATIGISVLCERCLVTVERNKLNMHDLLREMARVIISEKSPRQPEKWSRLWNPQDVTHVLTKKSGTEEVEGLALHFPNKSSCFSTEAFAHMNKLRLLQLRNVKLNGEYKHLPKELIWLRWRGCPLESIPDDFFNQDKLVFLEMIGSGLVKVWEGSKSLQNLKIINLTGSGFLIKSPDFSQVPNLEELILEGCISLLEIHPSIGNLTRLSLVNLEWCNKLVSLPRDFYRLKSVETLLLNGCYQFRELHEDLREMESLRVLRADKTSISQLPHTTVRLKKLTHLSIMAAPCAERFGAYCIPTGALNDDGIPNLRIIRHTMGALNDDGIPKDLGSLSSLQFLDLGGNDFHTLPSFSGLSKLETLLLRKCKFLHTIPDLPTNLKFLHANSCPALETMPNFSEMTNMRELDISDSPKLIEVPGLDKSLNSMTSIHMINCTSLTADFKKKILQGWTSCGLGGIFLHWSYVPDWFEFVNDGNKVSFDIPPSDDHNFEGLALFCISQCSFTIAITIVNNTKHTKLRETIRRSYLRNYLWQGHISNDKLNLQSGDKVDVIFGDRDYPDRMKRIGVNLVWDKPMK